MENEPGFMPYSPLDQLKHFYGGEIVTAIAGAAAMAFILGLLVWILTDDAFWIWTITFCAMAVSILLAPLTAASAEEHNKKMREKFPQEEARWEKEKQQTCAKGNAELKYASPQEAIKYKYKFKCITKDGAVIAQVNKGEWTTFNPPKKVDAK